MMTRFLRRTAAALCLLSAACGGDSDSPPTILGSSAVLFPADRVLEISITLSPADWDALRTQGRSLADIFGSGCLTGPFPSPFTWFPATVVLDGRTLPQVAVRKKGFLGSLDEQKPSLKLKFDEYVPGREVFGLERLSLNNCKQDPAYLRQALAYATFARAGIPSPRCAFARVTVNGAELGLFSTVESVDREFLRDRFGSDQGSLYEGTLSDFRPQWINTFDKKTNEQDPNRADLQAVVDALASPDATVLDALARVVDVDQFLTFWATEVIVNHWDGYANNTNNFFIHADRAGGPFRFMPWGTDGVLSRRGVPGGGAQPLSVFAKGALARRLYLLPATQARYLARLRSLLDSAWNESSLLAEVDRMEALIAPVADPDSTRGLAAAVEAVRDFIRTRRAEILNELAAGPPAWTRPPADPPCFTILGEVSGTFSTTFGTLAAVDPFAAGTGTLAGTVLGAPRSVVRVGAKAGDNPDPNAPGTLMTQVIAVLSNGTVDVVALVVDPEVFASGRTVPLDWGSAFGALLNFNPAGGTTTLVGLILGGEIEFTQASAVPGAPVVGRFQGQLVEFGP